MIVLFYFRFQIKNIHFLKNSLHIFFLAKSDQFLTDSLLKYTNENIGDSMSIFSLE
jgi:hypothetical protein